MTSQRHDDPDILESAISEFRQQGESQGPDALALARTREAMRAAGHKEPGIGLAERIRHMKRSRIPLLVSGAAAAVLIAVAAWVILSPTGNGGNVFASTRQQIEQAQTMTMTVRTEMQFMGKSVKSTAKVYFKSPGLMRQEITTDMSATAPGPKGATAPAPQTTTTIMIFDLVKHKTVTLSPAQKFASVVTIKNMPADMAAKAKQENYLEALKTAVADKHEELGVKTVDGKDARGYRCGSFMNSTVDIWVEASTGTPLLVEHTVPEGVGLGKGKVTMTDFKLNPQLDNSLFDMTVPKGYHTLKQDLDYAVTEADLIKGLGVVARNHDGIFPQEFMPVMEVTMYLVKAMAKVPDEQKMEKMQQVQQTPDAQRLQKLMMFQIMTVSKGGEFVYAGDGVKLGDKATPILWYKAKDAKVYRVIYGDLHAEDAATPPKAPATQASQPATGAGEKVTN